MSHVRFFHDRSKVDENLLKFRKVNGEVRLPDIEKEMYDKIKHRNSIRVTRILERLPSLSTAKYEYIGTNDEILSAVEIAERILLAAGRRDINDPGTTNFDSDGTFRLHSHGQRTEGGHEIGPCWASVGETTCDDAVNTEVFTISPRLDTNTEAPADTPSLAEVWRRHTGAPAKAPPLEVPDNVNSDIDSDEDSDDASELPGPARAA